ncbi:hypothetical protein NN561_008329 [Cricetulus griseus]
MGLETEHVGVRKCSDSWFCLASSDKRSPSWVSAGARAHTPSLSLLGKGVNSQPPAALGLEHQADGRESALRAPARRKRGASSAFGCIWPAMWGCMVAAARRPRAPQSPLPAKSSLCAATAVESCLACRRARGEHTRRRPVAGLGCPAASSTL